MKFKALVEKRNSLVDEMEKILAKAEEEKRAFDDKEVTRFEEIRTEIAAIDTTLKLSNKTSGIEKKEVKEERTLEEEEKRCFNAYLRNKLQEYRAETSTAINMDVGNNGAIIPKTIANKIIETVENMCSIYREATTYNVKGELVFPVYDETEGKVECAYADEFQEIASSSGKFASVSLKSYLAGALTKVSMSLINNNDFDLVNYVIVKIAQAIVRFLEHECLIGTDKKMTGALSCSQVVESSAATIKADDIIDLQCEIPQIYQAQSRWTMNNNTLKALRKLKDNDGQYLLNKDLTTGYGFMLLGRPVEISDQMPDIGEGTTPILYGDYSGLYLKFAGDMTIQVLQEKYATEHCIGVVAWVEADSKIVEPQKLAKLTMKKASA